MKALLSGFYISGRVGQKLAKIKELRDSDTVWSFPVFTLSFLDNPAPLLLYDEILFDERVAPLTISYLYNSLLTEHNIELSDIEPKMKRLEQLFSSEIFKDFKLETLISDTDIEQIGKKVVSKIRGHDSWFKSEVDELKLIYGEHYAAPSPLNFEAMNTELIWHATEKLSETDDDVSILDDCARGNLYRSKVHQLVSEKVRNDVAKQFFNLLPTYVIGLPELKLENVDAFLELHQSHEIRRFREIVTAISLEKDENMRTRLIKSELYQANEQAIKTHPDNTSRVNLMGVVLGIGATITGFVNDISWLSGFGFASTTFTSLPLLKEALSV